MAVHNSYELILYKLPLNILWSGNFAVCIFFILSGFVLSYKYLQTKDASALQSAAFRRYPRLMIPVFVSVMIGWLLIKLGLFWNQEQASLWKTPLEIQGFWSQTDGLLSAIYQGTIGVFTNIMPYSQHFNPVLWTMYYEFIGSFIVFGTLALFPVLKTRRFIYIFLFMIFIKTYFLGFVLGMLIADLHTNNKLRKKLFYNKLWGYFALVSGLFLGSTAYPTTDISSIFMVSGQKVQILHIIGGSLTIYGILCLANIQKLLSVRPVVFLGRISFAMYLLHTFIIVVFSRRVFYYFFDYLEISYRLAFLATSILTLLVVFIVSYIYTILVDEKALLISKKLYEKFVRQA